MNAELADLVGRLKGAGRITADDVLAIRAQVYGAEPISPDELEALAPLDAAVPDRAPEWVDFFAEATTDYVVHQQDPPDYVDDGKAEWLTRILSGAGAPGADTALEALARVLEAATEVPPSLTAFALDKAKAAVIARGWIGAADTALLRRLVFAAAGDRSLGVSRDEADLLFDINDACRTKANDPAWADFFAKAIADCLTAGNPFHTESRQDALRDEAWLQAPDSLGRFAMEVAKGMEHPDFRGALDAAERPSTETSAWAAIENDVEAADAQAAPISDDEARWLVSRLGQGQLSDGERRLIGLLKGQVADVSGLLQPLLDAAPAIDEQPPEPPAADVSAPVFGHRRARLA